MENKWKEERFLKSNLSLKFHWIKFSEAHPHLVNNSLKLIYLDDFVPNNFMLNILWYAISTELIFVGFFMSLTTREIRV